MKIFGRTFFERPTMEAQGGADEYLETLARHLVNAANGGGELNIDAMLGGNQRDQFIRFPGLARTVDLISFVSAELICDAMTIRNRYDELVINRRTDKIMEMMTHSPDNGVTAAHTFVEDTMADYLLDGNGLNWPMIVNGAPLMMKRYRPHGAYTVRGDGPLTYYAQQAIADYNTLDMIPGTEMIHMRWPMMRRGFIAENSREHFAVAPVTILARALVTGILQDRYVNTKYKNPAIAQVAMMFNSERAPQMDQDQVKMIRDGLVERMRNSPVATGFDTTVTEMSSAPVNEAVLDAQTRQLQEVVRLYGIPLPLLSVPLGQWTRGINEQVMKMAWRNCFKPHLTRYLRAAKTKLLMPHEKFHIDPTELVRGDPAGIAELVNALQGDAQRNPIASQKELRRMSGLPAEVDGEIVNTVMPKDEPPMIEDQTNQTDMTGRPPTRGTPMAELIKIAK